MCSDGFTDVKANDTYNLMLSKSRSETCKQHLQSSNIAQEKLVTIFYDKAVPIAPNNTVSKKDDPEGRQHNRRAELTRIIP